MLWNPANEVFSLAGLEAWLERQPADGKYQWSDFHECLATRYMAERLGTASGPQTWERYTKFARTVGAPALITIAARRPYTFAAALDRLRAWRRQHG